MRDNEKKMIFLSVKISTSRSSYSDEREEGIIKNKHKRTENIHNSGWVAICSPHAESCFVTGFLLLPQWL